MKTFTKTLVLFLTLLISTTSFQARHLLNPPLHYAYVSNNGSNNQTNSTAAVEAAAAAVGALLVLLVIFYVCLFGCCVAGIAYTVWWCCKGRHQSFNPNYDNGFREHVNYGQHQQQYN